VCERLDERETKGGVWIHLHVCRCVCMRACLSVCMFVYLYICLSVCLSICERVCISIHIGGNRRATYHTEGETPMRKAMRETWEGDRGTDM